MFLQSFSNLDQKPQLVDLTVEEGQRLKVIYGSNRGFHAIDLDTSQVFDIYIPSHVSKSLVSSLCKLWCLLSSGKLPNFIGRTVFNLYRSFGVITIVMYSSCTHVDPIVAL